MTSIRPLLFLALSAVTLSCGSKPAPDTTLPVGDPDPAGKVEVSIAAVTLADDCGTGPTAAPITAAHAPADDAGDVPAGAMGKRASMSQDRISAGARACEQSSIQLRVANGTAEAAKVAIQKIELVDESGEVIGELTPREPSKWADDTYQAWDEQVAPAGVLQVSYALSQPLVMRGATYTVRVTINTADGERTLEQQTTLEAEGSLPPGAVT